MTARVREEVQVLLPSSHTLNHLVIGLGEVGRALLAVLDGLVGGHDQPAWSWGSAETLHICFPWSDQFIDQVAEYERSYSADLVVVHSTVPIGTCDPHGWVHSPIRGRHPHLVESLRTFVKFFGGARAQEAASVFEAVGVSTAIVARAAETEAGKLWELVQFGLQVKVEQAIWDHCVESGLDPDVVYRQFAQTYNAGYRDLGDWRFTRPVLEHMPGPIGGHCVRQNAALLNHPLARLVSE